MQPITLTAVVNEDGHLIVDVPPDIPPGPVEVMIWSLERKSEREPPQPITREWARAKLIAAGLLNPSTRYAPPDAKPLSPEERARIGRTLAAGRSVSELIDEEREERF